MRIFRRLAGYTFYPVQFTYRLVSLALWYLERQSAQRCQAVLARICEQNIAPLRAIWFGQYRPTSTRSKSWLENGLLSLPLIIRCFSASNLLPLVKPARPIGGLIDAYLTGWIVAISVSLFWLGPLPWWATIPFLYRLLDILDIQLCVLLIDSRRGPHLASLERSFLSAFANLYEIVAVYGLVYSSVGVLVGDRVDIMLDGPLQAFYYSFVTMATLGGEFAPGNDLTRGIVIAELTTTIILVLAVLPAIVSSLSNRMGGANQLNDRLQ